MSTVDGIEYRLYKGAWICSGMPFSAKEMSRKDAQKLLAGGGNS